jgi:hypothetical protein
VALRPVRNDAEYSEIHKREFGKIVGENAFKLESIHPLS